MFYAKRAIINYINTLLKQRDEFYNHIKNSIGTRLRIAKYLIENLNAAEYLSSVNLDSFLSQKRHPVDTKGLHGKFGTIKIEKILRDFNFIDDTMHNSRQLSSETTKKPDLKNHKFSYVKEIVLKEILKRKDRKPKKFDFILLIDDVPRILIETNFYSTSGGGTKIGINQGEYVDLHEDIQIFNQKNKDKLIFTWITDGNYWLSRDGEDRFNNLKTNYFKKDYEFLNYNLFKEYLPKIKEIMVNNE